MQKESSSSVKIFYPRHSRSELATLLRARLATLVTQVPLRRAVLFGSWAKGRATAFSDIDLIVIYADPPREEAGRLLWKGLDLRGLELHLYTEQQAEQQKSLLERMTQDGIVVFP